MEYEIILQYIRPELLVLVVMLYLIGVAIKKTKYIKDELIPFILGILGILVSAIYILAVSPVPTGYKDVLWLIFDIIVQGVLCAAAAVFFNQAGKQYNKLTKSDTTNEVK